MEEEEEEEWSRLVMIWGSGGWAGGISLAAARLTPSLKRLESARRHPRSWGGVASGGGTLEIHLEGVGRALASLRCQAGLAEGWGWILCGPTARSKEESASGVGEEEEEEEEEGGRLGVTKVVEGAWGVGLEGGMMEGCGGGQRVG